MKNRSRPAFVALALTFALLAPAAAAEAATITVNTTDDTSVAQCALREAIIAANTNAGAGGCTAGSGADVVDLTSQVGTITLATALPQITTAVDLQGPGAGNLTISGADQVRVFDVGSGGDVGMSGLTISHGRCSEGCGIRTDGTVTLDGVTVEHNVATVTGGANAFPEGGGILNSGVLTLTLSTVSSNSATAVGATSQNGPAGGGIWNNGLGTVTLDRSTVSDNSAMALAAPGGTANVNGGGIVNVGSLNVIRSTLSGNSAIAQNSSTQNSALGGAIENANAASVNVLIDRSTISDNSVLASDPNPDAQAGAFNVPASAASVAIKSTTISGNSAGSSANVVFLTVATVKNTIIANPLGGGSNCSGSATSQGYNLTDGTGCGFSQPTDQLNTDPLFNPAGLADNGGPTKTIAPLPASPAVDQGLSSAGETVDQRGEGRPSDVADVADASGGDGTDVGAYEIQDTVAPDTLITSGPIGGSRITDRAPAFAFSSDDPGATFECHFDAAAFAPCTSPTEPGAPLGDGTHTFEVRARDASANVDATPAKRTFTVDTTGPETTLTKVPKKKIKTRKRRKKVSISFTSEPGASFECKLDGAAFKPCQSPRTYKLKKGRHVIQVRATDTLGNVEATAARATVKIKRKRRR